MSETWTISKVTEVDTDRGLVYNVTIEMSDGKRSLFSFSDEVIEWRAAEYGIDPETEFDTLLDIILHEPYIPDPTHPDNFEADPVMKQGKTAPATRAWGRKVKIGDEVPLWLFNAPDTQAAREAHLVRVEHTKNSRVKVVSAKAQLAKGVTTSSDPLDVIRKNHVIDRDRIEAKRNHVEATRNELKARVDHHLAKQTKAKSANSSSPRVIPRPLPPSREPRVKQPMPQNEVQE